MITWYLIKPQVLTSPDGTEKRIVIPQLLEKEWDTWTAVDADGNVTEVPMRARRKYRFPIEAQADDPTTAKGAVPKIALVRVEHEGDPPFSANEVVTRLDSQAKWTAAIAENPKLKDRFADQPRLIAKE